MNARTQGPWLMAGPAVRCKRGKYLTVRPFNPVPALSVAEPRAVDTMLDI